ncbi:MAG: DUF4412 domain-containing protein [Steroidobacteraceae bacterium]
MRATLVVTSLLLGAGSFAHAAEPIPLKVEYSADYVLETADGAMRGRLNGAPGLERREDLVEGSTMVSIRRDDKKVMWMLMPSERMYMEMKFGQMEGGKSRAPSPEEYKTEFTEAGREEVNGMMTTKSKVIMTGADGSKMGGFWWTTDDGLLVKMDVISVAKGEKIRMKRELTNVKIGPQPKDLFEIPAGYQSMSMGLAGGMLGLPRVSDDAKEGGKPAEGQPAAEQPKKKKGFGLGVLKDALDVVR